MKLAYHQKTRLPFIRKKYCIYVCWVQEKCYAMFFFRANQWHTFPYLCRKKHDELSQHTINEFVEKVFMSPYGFYLNVFVHTGTILRNYQPILYKWSILDFTMFLQSKRQCYDVHRMNLIMHRVSLSEQLPKTYLVLHFSCRNRTFSVWFIWLSEITMLFTRYLFF